jgi:hypothetical protein
VCLGVPIGRSVPGGAVDLQVIYYATKCFLQGCDPYKPAELRAFYSAEEKRLPPNSIETPGHVAPNNYLPPTFLIIGPLALLPWSAASALWLGILLGSFFLAGLLVVQTGSSEERALSLLLGCIVLANAEIGFALANAAILVVSFCTIAVYLLVENKFVLLGQVTLTLALALKPHDAGLILLYFLIAAGIQRKRAWGIAGIALVILLVSILWTIRVSPHWIKEWHSNIASLTARGSLNDPGPMAEKSHNAGQVIDLQAAVSVIRDEPNFYNSISYCICGSLLLIWGIASIRQKFSTRAAWLAMAAGVPLSLLVTYHRSYDAKMLLLSIPACAMLWRRRGWTGRVAVSVTTAAIVVTADLPLQIFSRLTAGLDASKMGVWERVLIIPVIRPAPMALLAMAVFYLWVYARPLTRAREAPTLRNVG